MLRAEQYTRVSTLTDEEARIILAAHKTPRETPVAGLLAMITERQFDHAKLLDPLWRTTNPTAVHAIETIVGRPITRVIRVTRHAPTRLTRPPRPRAADNRVITAVQPNPKKVGSASYDRFALYREGMTVSEALAAGVTSADVKWDSDRGYITIGDVR